MRQGVGGLGQHIEADMKKMRSWISLIGVAGCLTLAATAAAAAPDSKRMERAAEEKTKTTGETA